MRDYTKFAVKGAAAILLISLVSIIFGYLIRFSLARNLSVGDFGMFYSVFAFLSIFGIFKSLGFDRSLIKFIPEFRYRKKYDLIKSSILYVTFTQLVTNTIVIFGIYAFANYLSLNFFHNPQAGAVLRLMAIAFFIDNFVFVIKFSFQGFKKTVLFASVDLIRMVLLFGIILVGLRLNYGIFSPVAAYIIVPAILLLVFAVVLVVRVFPQFLSAKFRVDKRAFMRIAKYSLFVMSTGIGTAILGYTDSIMLTYFSGLESVGLYNVALPTATILIYIAIAIEGVLIPLTAELWVKKKKEVLSSGLRLLYNYSMVLIVPLAISMVLFADVILSVLYGKEYAQAGAALMILSIGTIFGTLYSINSNIFSGVEKPGINSNIVYFGAGFNFVVNIVLIPMMGIVGAAIATTISYVLMAILTFVYVRKFVEIRLPIMLWAKTALAGILFAVLVGILKNLINIGILMEIPIVLIVSGLFYIWLLFLLRVIDIGELKDLYRRVAK